MGTKLDAVAGPVERGVRPLVPLAQPVARCTEGRVSGFPCARCVTPARCGIYGCCPGTWPAEVSLAKTGAERHEPPNGFA